MTAALYQQHVRDAVAALTRWTRGLELVADMLDAQETPDAASAVAPALTALGSISRTYDEVLDHTLLLAELAHVSRRDMAKHLGVAHTTVNRRVKKLIEHYAED